MSEKLDLFIEGKFTKSDTKNWIEVLDPSNQERLCMAPCATDQEVERAITSAKEAFLTWKETPPPERSRVIMKYQELLKTHQDDIAKILSK
jgi:malonate-semialdehyde dehydrogenase (acetylating)/methylmalonate-semialdehyde dehydrogenase